MVPEQSDDAPEPIRVTDRRRFTEMGDERPSEDGAQVEPVPRVPEPAATPREGLRQDATSASRPAHTPSAAADPPARAVEGPGTEVLAGGIQPVFYILWQSALLALGAQDAEGNALPPDLAEARSAISLLQVLQQKTTGNLTPEEAELLRQLLHDAQVRYVQVADALASGR